MRGVPVLRSKLKSGRCSAGWSAEERWRAPRSRTPRSQVIRTVRWVLAAMSSPATSPPVPTAVARDRQTAPADDNARDSERGPENSVNGMAATAQQSRSRHRPGHRAGTRNPPSRTAGTADRKARTALSSGGGGGEAAWVVGCGVQELTGHGTISLRRSAQSCTSERRAAGQLSRSLRRSPASARIPNRVRAPRVPRIPPRPRQ